MKYRNFAKVLLHDWLMNSDIWLFLFLGGGRWHIFKMGEESEKNGKMVIYNREL